MNKVKFILILLSAFISLSLSAQFRNADAYTQLHDSEMTASLRSHITYLSSAFLEGRSPGSEGEKEAAIYIHKALKAEGVDMLTPEEGSVFGMKRENGDTLTSRNVYGFIQGYDKQLRDRYIVVGARMDNLGTDPITIDGVKTTQTYYGANGNASGVAAMIQLAKMVSTNSILFRRSILFVGFGASTDGMAGSWYFLNRDFVDVDKIDAMINLDMLGTGYNGFYAYTASNKDLNAELAAMANSLQPITPELVGQEPHPSDHRTFYAGEIPSVYFTTGQYPQHNTSRDIESIIDYDYMERELEYIYNFTLSIANNPKKISFHNVSTPEKVQKQDAVSYNECDYKPMFQNSPEISQFMRLWVYQYLKYPKEALEEGIQGTVQVSFIIEKDGKVTGARVVKGVHESLDAEALKVVAASPKWRPGRVDGEKVRTSLTIPVEFKLEKKKGFGVNGKEIKKR